MMLWIEKTYTAYSDELASNFEFSVAFGVSGTVAVTGQEGLPLHGNRNLGFPGGCTGSGISYVVLYGRNCRNYRPPTDKMHTK